MAYPLLARGERFPFRALDAETFLLGRPDTDADVFAALLLGVACVERLCFDRVTMLGAPTHGSLTFTGGATRNEYWSQLRTDMLGREVHLPEQNEPALGMAILAATSSGRSAKDAVATMVRRRGERTPNPARTSQLAECYAQILAALTARGWLDDATATYAVARL
jgi:sugar (pentulose or hexulose) kinase